MKPDLKKELELVDAIDAAKRANDQRTAWELTQELIDLQKSYDYPEPPSDDILVRKHGVRREHLERERQLAAEIKQAQGTGDLEKEKELRAELKKVQGEQPGIGPKFG